jgi:CubicO group peptidase (beta-lactamase class C family)
MAFRSEELAARITSLFENNFVERGELGAAVSIWRQGEPVLELSGGFRDAHQEQPWTNDTLVLFWSATKGMGSACLLHLLQQRGISLQEPVAEFWPEFSENGKAKITIAQLLSHQAGLVALDQPAEITNYDAVVRALARQQPFWPPGTAHGYHARTFGFLIDELVRRIDSRPIAEYWRQTFAKPLGLDIWIGLPPEENHRVAKIYPAKVSSASPPSEFYRHLTTPGTIQRRAFTSPHGLQAVSAMNTPENRARPLVSLGGIGSARSLGKFYTLLANGGELAGQRFFSSETIGWMTGTLVDGIDRVFEIPTAFSAGFMKDSAQTPDRIFGPSPSAFGHPGAGGSHAFADPENALAFAYVMNQMERAILPNEKSLRMVNAIYR